VVNSPSHRLQSGEIAVAKGFAIHLLGLEVDAIIQKLEHPNVAALRSPLPDGMGARQFLHWHRSLQSVDYVELLADATGPANTPQGEDNKKSFMNLRHCRLGAEQLIFTSRPKLSG
jgi:hypothetical protein